MHACTEGQQRAALRAAHVRVGAPQARRRARAAACRRRARGGRTGPAPGTQRTLRFSHLKMDRKTKGSPAAAAAAAAPLLLLPLALLAPPPPPPPSLLLLLLLLPPPPPLLLPPAPAPAAAAARGQGAPNTCVPSGMGSGLCSPGSNSAPSTGSGTTRSLAGSTPEAAYTARWCSVGTQTSCTRLQLRQGRRGGGRQARRGVPTESCRRAASARGSHAAPPSRQPPRRHAPARAHRSTCCGGSRSASHMLRATT